MTMGDLLSSIKKRKRADVMQASRECLVKNYGKDHAFIMDLEINDHSKSRSNKGVRPQKARLSDLTFENIYFAFQNLTINQKLPMPVKQMISKHPSIPWSL